MVGLVVPAAGRGSRFGSLENKVWADLAGRTLLDRTLSAFQTHPRVDVIVLVGAAEELDRLRALAERYDKVRAVVTGGPTRQESVGNGLAALPDDCEIVLVHDAARPCVSHALITRVIEATERYGAAIPGLPVSDTVKRVDGDGFIEETVPRDGLWTVQTPQGARLADLREAYAALGPAIAQATDEASVLEMTGYPVRMVEGEADNLKVTRPGDLERAALALGVIGSLGDWVVGNTESQSPNHPTTQRPIIRTGFGYDVHPFMEGRPLWLGGVRIPHPRGLRGHSDADAMLHAVCDALLGAAAMGDIGMLFPDTEDAHKDRPSIEFIEEVRWRLEEAGWQIVNIDVALLAEEPRIGPYRMEMVAALAGSLQIAPTQINIKATTSEKLGFVGRREGIACWAVATITRLIVDS
jgi:2-C-methyl-D-erythritol 4-phosphate cytidylyltransferase/2-C-methyl-D-erythritol 2,4-cyclodiphosphate synthase